MGVGGAAFNQNFENATASVAFEYGERRWVAAYHALDRSWGLDRHGPAGVHCGLLDRVRPRVTGYGPKCRRSGQAANP